MWDNIVEFIQVSEDSKSISLLYKPSKLLSKENCIIQNGDFHLDGNISYLLKNETLPKITLSQVSFFSYKSVNTASLKEFKCKFYS